MEKEKWKSIVKKKIMIATEKELRDETEKLKKYKEIAKDEIEVGKQKRYMRLPVKKAASLFRARTNQLDPSPRKPYWSRKWRCRFCREKRHQALHPGMQEGATDSRWEDNKRRDVEGYHNFRRRR